MSQPYKLADHPWVMPVWIRMTEMKGSRTLTLEDVVACWHIMFSTEGSLDGFFEILELVPGITITEELGVIDGRGEISG